MKGLSRFGLAVLIALTAAGAFAENPGGGNSTQATCSAWCFNGTTHTVSCSGSCSAVDASCPDQLGYVACNGGISYCPAGCPAGPYCEDVSGTSCTVMGSWTTCAMAEGMSDCICNNMGVWFCLG